MIGEILASWSARAGLAIIAAVTAMAIVAPIAYPDIPHTWNNPDAWSLNPKLAPPIWAAQNATPTLVFEGCRAVIDWGGGRPRDLRVEGVARNYTLVLVLPNGSELVLQSGEGPAMYYSAITDHRLRRLLGLGPLDNPVEALFAERGRYVVEVRGSCSHAIIALIGSAYGLLGTDQVGRDVWVGLVWGARQSLLVGLVASLIGTAIATLYGIVNGLAGRRLDSAMLLIVDTLYNLPVLPILILITFAYGKPGPLTTAVLIGIFGWMGAARIIRGMVAQVKYSEYVLLARASGVPTTRLVLRYILPAVAPYSMVTFVLSVPTAILTDAVLAFLGLTDPTYPSWGRMIEEAMNYVAQGYWWLWVPPGAMLVLTSLGFMLLGSAMEEVVNPRLRLAKA